MTPLVSIIVPIFNRELYVEQLILTVQNQTYSNWELLLIDDGSTDRTAELIEEHKKADNRIKYFHNRNAKGASGARNSGLDVATGKYIAYQDSDDEWIKTHLETMVYYLEKYSDRIDLMSANPLRKYRESGDVFNYDVIALEQLSFDKLEEAYIFPTNKAFDYQLRGRIITTQCIVGKREVIIETRWDEALKAATDNLYNLKLAASNIKIGHVQEYHAIYWAHDDNITNCGGKHDVTRMERVQRNFVKYWRILLEDFPLSIDQKRFVKTNLSETLAWHYAYTTLEPQQKYRKCIGIYFEAFLLSPMDIRKLISCFKVMLKYLIFK